MSTEILSLNVNLENLTAEERDNLMKLVEKSQEKKSKVWKPRLGERFYLISTCGTLDCRTWQDDASCNNLFEIGNAFPTREAAEEEATRRRMLAKWKRLSIESGEEDIPWGYCHFHWSVFFDDSVKRAKSHAYSYTHDGNIFFASREALEAAIEELGEDNVKKYIIGIKE